MGPIRAERHRLRLLKAQEPVLDNPHPDEVQGWSSCENLHTIVAPFKRGLKPKVLAKIKKRETYQRGSRELAKIPREKVSLYPKKAKPQPILEGFSQLNISDWRDDDFNDPVPTTIPQAPVESFTQMDVSDWRDEDFNNPIPTTIPQAPVESFTQIDTSDWRDDDFKDPVTTTVPQPPVETLTQLDISNWRSDDFDTDDHTASFTDLNISNWTDTDFDNYQDVDVTKWSHNDFSK